MNVSERPWGLRWKTSHILRPHGRQDQAWFWGVFSSVLERAFSAGVGIVSLGREPDGRVDARHAEPSP
jgi:hypothetical protein